jgi:hypothetical protein
MSASLCADAVALPLQQGGCVESKRPHVSRPTLHLERIRAAIRPEKNFDDLVRDDMVRHVTDVGEHGEVRAGYVMRATDSVDAGLNDMVAISGYDLGRHADFVVTGRELHDRGVGPNDVLAVIKKMQRPKHKRQAR